MDTSLEETKNNNIENQKSTLDLYAAVIYTY